MCRLMVDVSTPSDLAARPKLLVLAAAARYLRSTDLHHRRAPSRPGMQPSDANHSARIAAWSSVIGNGERINGLSFAKHMTTLSFRSPGSVSCSARVPAVPRGWPPARTAPGAGATRLPSGIVAGRRRPLWANRYGGLFRQETRHWSARHSAGLVRTRTRRLRPPRAAIRDGLSRISDAGTFLLPGVEYGIIAHLRCGLIQWPSTWLERR